MGFQRAKAAVEGGRFADLRWVATTGSTNADARELAASEPTRTQPFVLVADHQSAGRGRRGRDWQAPPGTSLLMTVAVRVDDVPVRNRALLGTALALAAAEAQPELRLKWPNDLVVEDPDGPLGYLKVGGVLAEVHQVPAGAEWVLIGMGVNANWPEIPDELAGLATSIDRVVGRPVDREELTAGILGGFGERWLPLVEAGRIGDLLDAYRERCATLGSRVRIQMEGQEVVGTAVDVAGDGALVVRDDDGSERTVTVGDVVHLRPHP